jgi:phosphatidylserine/phosphatidylglycerophosphate/cardiolipin synthase-like enzyme
MADSTQLLSCYDDALDALVTDAAACGPGDAIEAMVYLVEPGASSERLLEALAAAAARGARVRVAVDWTAGSHLARLVERTTTLLPRLEALARERPERVTVTRRRTPDHAKWFRFERPAGTSSAVLGSLNLGDRFRDWRDLALRVAGREQVDALARALAGDGPDLRCAAPEQVAFVTNVPDRARWDVRPALEGLLADPALVSLQMAMAYVDLTGAALLEAALARGVRVDLTLPARANVYQQANLRAAARLLARGARVRLVPGMLHAKALVAYDAAGPRAAWLGSPNLKRNSFRLFGELAALVTEQAFVRDLARALDALGREATPLARAPRYGWLRAVVEERLG